MSLNAGKDNKPFFSIVIPTYNSAGTIAACVESIVQQSFQDIEVLIMDGLSTDSTIEILEDFKRQLPSLKIKQEKDKGIYDAMNKGLDCAQGEYLYFIGSDDTLYDKDVLGNIFKLLSPSQPKILYGNVRMQGSNQWVEDGLIHAGEFDLKRLLSHNISHQAIFYHRSVFDKLGRYNTTYPIFADYDMNLRCFANYSFVYTDTIIANFKVGGASTGLADTAFDKDKLKNIINYFHTQLFSRAFVDCRLFVQRAAFSAGTGISLLTRLYCMLAYAKLKTQALLAWSR